MTENNETPKNWCEHVKDIPHFLMVWGCADGSDEVIMFCPVCAAPRPGSTSKPEEGKELERRFNRPSANTTEIAAVICQDFFGMNEPAGLRDSLKHWLDKVIAIERSIDPMLTRALPDGTSESYPTSRVIRLQEMEITDLKSRIEKQAIVLEGYKILVGLSEPDPIKIFSMVEDRLKKAEEELEIIDNAHAAVEKELSKAQADLASRDAVIVEWQKSLYRIAHNGWPGHWAGDSYEEARRALVYTPSAISSELDRLRNGIAKS